MSKANFGRRAGALLSLLSMCLSAQPALAAQDFGSLQQAESRRSAFAGASFRAELGARSRAPSARLQAGIRSVAGDSRSTAFNTRHVPVLEIGLGGRENGTLFIAGRSRAEFERRLGVNSLNSPLEIFLVVGLVAVFVYTACCLTLLNTD